MLFGLGQAFFAHRAAGSLLNAEGEEAADGKHGSRLIAQPFTNDEYFWPRPSAASYSATAAGASNWGANNPKLRDRVAQQLGPMVMYKTGSKSAGTVANPRTPQRDIEAWFTLKPDRVAAWAADSSVAAPNWAKIDMVNDKYGLPGEYILQWAKDHSEVVADWKRANPDNTDDPKPEDMVAQFFSSFAQAHPGKWPGVVETKQADGTTRKRIEPVASDAMIQANFFDLWLSDPANKEKALDLEPVPADMVTASGSGLDPHIALRNALSAYQLDRVAIKRAPSPAGVEKLKQDIANLLREKSFTPLSGLVGEPLVNVLEVNIELDKRFPMPSIPAKP
jgi:K+-transporting ATPase ATPase C chain